MTASELLVLVGRAWSRLLLYPGGLTAFSLAWLITIAEGYLKHKCGAPRSVPSALPDSTVSRLVILRELEELARSLGRTAQAGIWRQTPSSRIPVNPTSARFWLAISAVVFPWLGVALLPLPMAVALSRQMDVVVVLALLEWPLLLAVAQAIWSADAEEQRSGLYRAAAALNSYPALILATLALAQAAGSFDLAALAQPPDPNAPATVRALHWSGAVVWTLAQPPALGLGPFAVDRPPPGALHLGLRLRSIGLIMVAGLPWMAALESRPWLMPLPPLLLAALLGCCHWLTTGRQPRAWARAYLALDIALLLALLWAAYTALRLRLA